MVGVGPVLEEPDVIRPQRGEDAALLVDGAEYLQLTAPARDVWIMPMEAAAEEAADEAVEEVGQLGQAAFWWRM